MVCRSLSAHISLLWVSVREVSGGQKPRHCKGYGLCCQALSRKGLLSFYFYHQCWERQKEQAQFRETLATLGITGFFFFLENQSKPIHWMFLRGLQLISLAQSKSFLLQG